MGKPKYLTCEMCGKLVPKLFPIPEGGLYHPFRDACAKCAKERGYEIEEETVEEKTKE